MATVTVLSSLTDAEFPKNHPWLFFGFVLFGIVIFLVAAVIMAIRADKQKFRNKPEKYRQPYDPHPDPPFISDSERNRRRPPREFFSRDLDH